MNDPLEIRHLRYFMAVAEAGSFSRAADRLGVSQPSVSQQIGALETGLRVSLFQRGGRRVQLTPDGVVFEEHARAILHQLENLQQDLGRNPDEMRGTLQLGVVPILNVPLIPDLLGRFAAENPGISLAVSEISSTEIETDIEEGRMDVGLGFVTRHSPTLRYECLCRDEFALIVSEEHPWARRRFIPIAELHQARILQLPDTFVMRRMTDEIFRNHQVRPRTIAEINAIETLLRSLAPLEAAAVMPRIALRSREGLRLKPIRLQGENPTLEIGLLHLEESGANAAVTAFAQLARTLVPKLVGAPPK